MKVRMDPVLAKRALHILISESNKAPWKKIQPVYIETSLAKDDTTNKDMLIVRVSKLPANEALPTSYFDIPITYLPMPQSN